MNISIIIPNYNGEVLLKTNLPKVKEALNDYTRGKVEIIIADDASSDGSVAVIEEFLKNLKKTKIDGSLVTNNDRSKGGFSANLNRGVAKATGDILIFLNTDVIPHKGFLEPLLNHFTDEKVFAVGCMDESIEDEKIVLRGRGIGKWQRGFLVHKKGEVTQSNTLWVSCGSGAFRSSIYKEIGGLNNMYNPFYWEDIDLSYKAQKAGYRVLFESKSKVTHEHSKGSITKNYKQFRIQKIVYRNMFFFVWLNITDRKFLFSHVLWLPYYFAKALLNKDGAFCVGFWLALKKLPQVMVERKKINKLFVLSDKEVLEKLL